MSTRPLDRVLRWSPLQPASRWNAARRLAVLAYHQVDDPEVFLKHVSIIEREANAISLDDLMRSLADGRTLPRRAVLVTFDDGDPSVLEVAAPMLRERGIPAIVFAIAAFIDSDRQFWWEEVADLVRSGGHTELLRNVEPQEKIGILKRVPDDERLAAIEELRRSAGAQARPQRQLTTEDLRELESLGFEVANHTVTHPCLPQCSADKVASEVHEAHQRLTKALGHGPRAFAYPNGDWDPRAEASLRELGYVAAFLFDHRLARLGGIDPMRISRLRVGSTTSEERFRIILSGLHPALHRLRGRT